MHPIKPVASKLVSPLHWENVTYAKDQPQYRPLPVLRSLTHEGYVMSCWQLTVWERLRILFGARIYLTQLTFNDHLQPIIPEIGRRAPSWIHTMFVSHAERASE